MFSMFISKNTLSADLIAKNKQMEKYSFFFFLIPLHST